LFGSFLLFVRAQDLRRPVDVCPRSFGEQGICFGAGKFKRHAGIFGKQFGDEFTDRGMLGWSKASTSRGGRGGS
jgi:hypothetical protein